MATNKLDKDGLQKLLDSVSASLSQVIAKAEQPGSEEPLVKATPGNEAPAEKTPTGSSTEGSKPEESSASEGGSDEGSDKSDSSGGDKSPPPAEGTPPAADASASPAPADGQAPAGDPAQDQGGSVESLQAEYAALPIEELKMHMLACKAALMSQMAGQGDQGAAPDAGMGAPAPGPDAGAAPPAPAPEGTPPIQKSEDTALLDRIAALEASNKTLAKSLEDKEKVIAGFGTIAARLTEKVTGQRKSVATMASIQKPGSELVKSESAEINLTYDQIKVKLNDVTANTKLSKSDRDAVISFVVGSNKDVSKIAHLLK